MGSNLTPTSGNIPRVNSLNAIPIVFGFGTKIVSNVYHIIWTAMYTLAADPHPRVSSAAQIIIDEIRSRSFSGMSTESLKESKSNSSISESSSPNTGATFSISDSPPSIGPHAFRANVNNLNNTNKLNNNNLTESGDASTATSTTMTTLNQTGSNNNNNFAMSPKKTSSNVEFKICDNNDSLTTTTTINKQLQPQPPPPPPPMPQPSNKQQQNPSLNNVTTTTSSNNQQQQVHNIDRITKSANVTINNNQSKSKRYASSRDNNISEDDNRSNLSSQKPLITTDFVDWCTKYFVDPENNYTSSARSSNSKEDQQKEWRMLRVLSYKNVCLRELMVIDPIRFNENLSSYKVLQVPNLLAVHPYDPIMVIAGKDEFSIMHLDGPHVNNYHYYESPGLASSISSASIASNPLLAANITNHHHHHNSQHHHHHHHSNHSHHHHHHNNHFHHNNGNDSHSHDLIGTQSNCHSSSSQITSLQLINPQYNTLVCTGSSEGSVRIWRAYNGIDYSFNPQLVTAFHLMPELQPHRQGSGMILLWDQYQSRFYATSDQNDVRIIKVWDANSESKVQDIPTCAEFGVSCLSSDGEHSIAAGFLDGSIRIYDTRLKKTDCRTFTFRKHSEKILTLHMYKPGEKHINLVSGDSGGEVRFWDKRAPTSVKRVDVGQKMSVMSVHPNADIFAW